MVNENGMQLTDEEKSRLTKKAQRYIQFLESELGISRRQVSELNAITYGTADSLITFNVDYKDDPTGLPSNSSVYFKVGDHSHPAKFGAEIRVRITASGELELLGDKRFTLEIDSSNLLRVRFTN